MAIAAVAAAAAVCPCAAGSSGIAPDAGGGTGRLGAVVLARQQGALWSGNGGLRQDLRIPGRWPSRSNKPGSVFCAVANEGSGGSTTEDGAAEKLAPPVPESKQSEINSRILSGEFTRSGPPGYDILRNLRNGLSNAGGVRRTVAAILAKTEWKLRAKSATAMPEAAGEISSIIGQPFFVPLYNLFRTYGSPFRLTFGPFKSFIIVSDPVVAKHLLRDNAKAYSKGILSEILEFVMGTGLIPADGEVWISRRRTVVPSLHKKFVVKMLDLFGNATQNLCKKLDIAAANGEDVEMEALFSRLTLDVIGKAVFNYEFDSLSNDTGIVEAVYVALRESEMRSTALFPYWKIPPLAALSKRQQKVQASLKFINGTLDLLIDNCKKILDEEQLSFHEEFLSERDPSILHFLLASGDEVTSKQLRDDLMTLLIAGHETSAAVLTWTFYLLAKNPDAAAKLQREVDNVLGDRSPTIDDIKKLKYTTRVINESMRLYPQPPVLIRRSLQNDKLGKYEIKPGEDIFISVWNLHRDPKLWDRADEFVPDRWPLDGPDPNEVSEGFRYLPFGGGPRKCIGDVFATFENITAVAMLARRFQFDLAVGAPPVGMTTGATIHTSEGLHMTITKRARAPIIPVIEEPVVTTISENGSITSYSGSNGTVSVFNPEASVQAEANSSSS